MTARMLLAVALAALLTPAAVQADDRPAALTGPLAQDYDPAPALWKLADADTTIYLFGTIHLLPEGFRWRNAQLDAVVAEAETLVVESTEDDAMASLEAFGPKMRAMAESRLPTSQRLHPALRDKWRAMVEMSGLQFEAVDAVPLPLAMMEFGFGGAAAGPSSYDYGVETVLEAEFAASGRPIESIEHHGAVMLSLMRIDDAGMLRDLEADLAQWSGKADAGPADAQPMDWTMEHDWARGRVAETFDLGLGSGKVGAAFQRALLAKRNEAWALWLDNRLDRPGTALVAVGAGHFEGRGSVHDFLAARGLAAERIN